MVSPITAKLGKVTHIVILTVLTVKILKFCKATMVAVAILTKNRKPASLTDLHRPTASVLPNKTANIIKQDWNQFLLVAKAIAIKQQISKFYTQILCTFMIGLS